jgi:hypothetical protein
VFPAAADDDDYDDDDDDEEDDNNSNINNGDDVDVNVDDDARPSSSLHSRPHPAPPRRS